MNENFNKFQLENNGLKKNTIDHILSGKYPEGGGAINPGERIQMLCK